MSKQPMRNPSPQPKESSHYDFDLGAPPVTAYVADVSYFSGKLEAYLRYKEIPFERQTVDIGTLVNEIYANTGMMKVPVIRLSDGQWLKDTTPMIQWFEQHKPKYSVIPQDPVTRFLALLVEDYADEWCWRSALYWRWYFDETKRLVGQRIGHEVLGDWPIPKSIAGWYFGQRQIKTYLKGDGVTKETEPFVKNHYTDMLASMQVILSDTSFLLGDQPSVADFGLFGPMFRHFGLDPAPAKVMIDTAPAVYEWLARMWNAKGSEIGTDAQFNHFESEGWDYFFKDLVGVYLPSLRANAAAHQQGQKRFDLSTAKVTYPQLKTVHYRVYCLEMLQREFAALNEAQQDAVRAKFAPYGTFDLGADVTSGLASEFDLPIPPNPKHLSWLEKAVLTATGTPWDLPRWKRRPHAHD